MKLDNDVAAADRRHEREVKAEREAFDSKWREAEQIRGESEARVRELEAELKEARRTPRERIARAAASHPGLLEEIDAMVGRGLTLYGELNTGPEPTEIDEEGRGISFPLWPPASKWDPVDAWDQEARDLLKARDAGLLFAYADGVNAARRKLRRRERQRDKAQEKLPMAEQLRTTVERLHRRPAEDLECFVNGLVDVKKALSS